MAEFFAVSSDDSAEEEEEEIGPWFSSPSDDEIDAFYGTPLHNRSDASGMDSDIFFPVFSPHYRYTSSDPLDHEVPSDSEDESCYDDDQFSLPADLPERSSRSPPLDDDGTGTDVCPNSVDPLDFGVLDGTEDMGSDYLQLGLGFGMERHDMEGNDDTEAQWRGVWGSDYGNDEPSTSRETEGLRIIGFGSDTESDLDEDDEGISSETIPFFDCGCGCAPESFLNDLHGRGVNDDFEWEEVEERLENSENLDINQEDEEQRSSRLEWEFLLTMNSLDSNSPADYEEFDDDHAEFGYSSENEILFEQFVGQESFNKGSPTAKHVIEDLPSIVLTQSAVCAVCKDEISLEENPKQLPCSHHYHADCIIPWLRMKNTCPVCRHELPTDDPDYELQRVMGAVRGTVTLHELESFD